MASVKGGREHRAWTPELVLLAGIFNALQNANYQRANGKGKKPKPIDPPPVRRRNQRPGAGRARAGARLARMAARARPAPALPGQEPPAPRVQRGGLGVPADT